jgi:hypothetical protein
MDEKPIEGIDNIKHIKRSPNAHRYILRSRTFVDFARWLAVPFEDRPDDLKYQMQFADKFKISAICLSTWKRWDKLWELRDTFLKVYLREQTPEVFKGMVKGAKKGYADCAKLLLKSAGGEFSKIDEKGGLGSDIKIEIEILPPISIQIAQEAQPGAPGQAIKPQEVIDIEVEKEEKEEGGGK